MEAKTSKKIVRLYEKGYTLRDIADELKVSRETVRKQLKDKVQLRNTGRKRLTPEEKKWRRPDTKKDPNDLRWSRIQSSSRRGRPEKPKAPPDPKKLKRLIDKGHIGIIESMERKFTLKKEDPDRLIPGMHMEIGRGDMIDYVDLCNRVGRQPIWLPWLKQYLNLEEALEDEDTKTDRQGN